MARLQRFSALLALFGSLVVLLTFSFDQESRLVGFEMSSTYHKDGSPVCPRKNGLTFFGRAFRTTHKKKVQRMTNPPYVTWLMSFPNSGTSYTMTNTEWVSGQSTATNYATEIVNKCEEPVPIRRNDGQVEDGVDIEPGPWQRNTNLPLTSKRVLCKTHCTAYDDKSSAKDSVRSYDSFLDGCRESTQKRDKTMSSIKHNKLHLYYPLEGLVDSAIHLIRDPFDNILSRMHLGFRQRHATTPSNLTSDELEAFMKSKVGLHQWCQAVDAKFWSIPHNNNNTKTISAISNRTLSLFAFDPTPYLHVPCFGEFFRYTQWHNYAIQLMKLQNLSVLTVHYEDYGNAYDQTLDQILGFLGQTRVNDPYPYESGKSYRDELFDKSVQNDVQHLIEAIASEETWAVLRGYFTSEPKWLEVNNQS